jgi:hypothetical protein
MRDIQFDRRLRTIDFVERVDSDRQIVVEIVDVQKYTPVAGHWTARLVEPEDLNSIDGILRVER